MEHHTRTQHGAAIVTLAGPVHSGDAERFSQSFGRWLDAPPRRLVLDLGALRYLDTTLITAVVAAVQRAAGRSVRVTLVAPPGTKARRILQIVALDRVLEILGSVEQALSSAA